MGQPVVGVSLNYRVGIWGFLQSFDLLREGSSNAGLLDQRLGLQWIQENIASFGGDPDKVVVWGESAGAQSIAYQMFSYEGRDDGLYRGAILESGGTVGAQVRISDSMRSVLLQKDSDMTTRSTTCPTTQCHTRT